jgi:hypothetical protein
MAELLSSNVLRDFPDSELYISESVYRPTASTLSLLLSVLSDTPRRSRS